MVKIIDMRTHFLILLVIPVIFGCEANKADILSERFELVNGTTESFAYHSKKEKNNLFKKLDQRSQVELQIVKDHSEGIINYLDKLKNVLVEKSGGRNPETAMLMVDDNFDIPYEFISRSVYRKNLKDTLNSISNLITEMELFEAPSFALDGSDDPYWSQIPVQKQKTLVQLLFEGVNVNAALASVSQLQLKVLEYERKAYETILFQELDSLRTLLK